MHQPKTLFSRIVSFVAIALLCAFAVRSAHRAWYQHEVDRHNAAPHEVIHTFTAGASEPPLAAGFIGDSLSHVGSPSAPDIAGETLSASQTRTVTVVNHAQSGSSTADWLPANPDGLFVAAAAACRRNHVSVVCVMLGTNDCRHDVLCSPAAYQSNMQTIATALSEQGFCVIVNAPPDPQPGGMGGKWKADALPLVRGYRAALPHLKNCKQGDTTVPLLFASPAATFDGVHPTQSTVQKMGQAWGKNISKSISKTFTSTP